MKILFEYMKKKKAKQAIKLFIQGNIALVEDMNEEAINCFTKCLKISNVFYEAYTCRATAYFSIGELKKALEDLESAIQLFPNEPEAYFDRGKIHIKNNEHIKAKSDLKQILKIFENNNLNELAESYGFPYTYLDDEVKDKLILQRIEEFKKIQSEVKEIIGGTKNGIWKKQKWIQNI